MNLRMKNLRKFLTGIPTKINPPFWYYVTDTDKATAYYYFGTGTNVKVDSTIDGYTITELAPTTCAGNTNIQSATIASSITKID